MDKQSIDGAGKSRVAIIGTGLAGLTTGYLLQGDERKRYSVTLFEQVRDIPFHQVVIDFGSLL
jgi:predicted NAD/FAD-binding protein